MEQGLLRRGRSNEQAKDGPQGSSTCGTGAACGVKSSMHRRGVALVICCRWLLLHACIAGRQSRTSSSASCTPTRPRCTSSRWEGPSMPHGEQSCVCVRVHLASTERATARVMQEGSAGRKIRHQFAFAVVGAPQAGAGVCAPLLQRIRAQAALRRTAAAARGPRISGGDMPRPLACATPCQTAGRRAPLAAALHDHVRHCVPPPGGAAGRHPQVNGR